MEVLFPEYFQSISRIFPYHGQHHFHTMELDKTFLIFSGVSVWQRNTALVTLFPRSISLQV